MDREIMEKARFFEGTPPDSWMLVGVRENRKYRLRYYRDPEGNYWCTNQRLRQEPLRYEVREDECRRTFARPVYPGRKDRRRMA